MSADKKPASFEEALRELEAIVATMESGQIPLEAMMKQFERGMALATFCSSKLGEAEKRIEILMRDAAGQPDWRPLPDEAPTSESPDDSMLF
ncbi:MAG: exodeoxyribonuclease VII small subunit [Lentisphaeria bacterium]|nr:exodeoxyribonuclease VII small subunit [Lentisphaeria bacterium]